jgi:hypothetical protein
MAVASAPVERADDQRSQAVDFGWWPDYRGERLLAVASCPGALDVNAGVGAPGTSWLTRLVYFLSMSWNLTITAGPTPLLALMVRV